MSAMGIDSMIVAAMISGPAMSTLGASMAADAVGAALDATAPAPNPMDIVDVGMGMTGIASSIDPGGARSALLATGGLGVTMLASGGDRVGILAGLLT